MLYVIGAGIGLLFVIGVVSAVVSALHALVRPPEGASYSANQLFLLLVVGFVSAFAAPRVFSIHGDGWWLLPVGVFAATLAGVKATAINTRDRQREAERQRVAEQQQRVEQRKQRVEQRKQRERERVERLGKDGIKTLVQMKAAVKRIAETEAAREGWLGDAAEINFSADLLLTEDQLAKMAAIRAMIGEAKRLPNPTDDDKEMAKEAEAAVRKLEAAVRERIQMIEGCARKAEEVDETLRAERRRAAVAEQRDALRGRLGAMLSGVELTPDSPPSDSVDAVNTRAEAFRELKDSIEPRNLGLDGGPNDSADDSSWTSALSRLWPW